MEERKENHSEVSENDARIYWAEAGIRIRKIISGMMREMDGCGVFNHKDLDTFTALLRQELEEGTGGRYEKGDIALIRTSGQLQIEVKRGLDYAARIDYTVVKKAFTYKAFSRERVKVWELAPDGEINFF